MKLDKAWRVDLTDQLNQGLCGCLRVNEIGIDRTFPNVPIIEAKVMKLTSSTFTFKYFSIS
jgi:hypothetical protein